MKEPYHGKENSESISGLESCGRHREGVRSKRRQRYQWAGRLSFEKPMVQDADSMKRGGRQHDNHDKREWIDRPCVVVRTRAR